MWVDNDVPNWFLSLKNFYHSPFSKWPPPKTTFEIEQWCRESIQDIIIYLYMKFRWNRTMLNLWSIVAFSLKMVTGRNFSMSGINSGQTKFHM
jgi:hypothetical protein